MKENVYLIPLANGTYVPCVAQNRPHYNAIMLTPEGNYPALAAYLEYDFYGCGEINAVQVNNRTELLDFLFTCGEMCNGIVKLWKYDMYEEISDDIKALFDTAYDTRMEAIRGDGAVNSSYAFTDTTSLDEFCAHCVKCGGKKAPY